MRRTLLLILWLFGLMPGGLLFADTITLKDGRQISGSIASGNTQELHVQDQSQPIDMHEVQAIQFATSAPASSAAPAKPAASGSASEPDALILKDGTRVAGRWWSIDASQVHFLVNSQLQQYARSDVSAVTLGGAELPSPAAPAKPTPAPAKPAPAPTSAQPAPAAAPPPATPAPRPTSAPQPESAPKLARSSSSTPSQAPSTPSQTPTLSRPSAGAPAQAQSRGVSQPNEIGAVYFWNGRDLTPLEHNQAAERKSGTASYFEIPGGQSSVRIKEKSPLFFILRLPKGVDPAGYSLFPLSTEGGNRRTKNDSSRRGGILTWPFKIEINDAGGYMTYALTVRDLPSGEYSFSPSTSNDGYCFGVDAAGEQ
jgi:hypothetical protein